MEEQSPKHSMQRTSTDDGIQIDFNARHPQNALDSIRVSFESDSNVKEESKGTPENTRCRDLQLMMEYKSISIQDSNKMLWTQFE
jgi:hypothetical protein